MNMILFYAECKQYEIVSN